jgi:hypothetical protein
MTTAAKIAFGTELWIGPAGGTLVKVPELLSVDPPKGGRDTIDATTHDSPGGAMEFITEGVYDPGDIKAQVNYIAGSTFDLAMIAARASGDKQGFKIVVKSAADTVDVTGECFVTEYGPDGMEVKGKQTAALSLKVTGEVDQAAS